MTCPARLYRPRAEILNGTWKFAGALPVEADLRGVAVRPGPGQKRTSGGAFRRSNSQRPGVSHHSFAGLPQFFLLQRVTYAACQSNGQGEDHAEISTVHDLVRFDGSGRNNKRFGVQQFWQIGLHSARHELLQLRLGGYFEDSAIAGYYAPSPGYGPYPPTPVYGYAPPPAYGYYPPVPVYGLYPPAPVYGYAPPPAYGYYPPAPGYYRSYYRAPTYRYRDVGWRRW